MPRNPLSLLSLFAVGIAVAVICGCGSSGHELVAVSGRVLLDGQPLTTGTVVTLPDHGRGAEGQIDSEGRFTLSSGDLGPGATAGVHHVAVVAVEKTEGFSPEAPVKLLVPKIYTNPVTSGLKIDVQPGQDNDVTLELSSGPE